MTTTYADALRDGQWTSRGLIQVWQPAPKLADLIACPVCRSTIVEHCPHPERLVSRRCACGDLPAHHDGHCADDELTCARRRSERQNPHSIRVSGLSVCDNGSAPEGAGNTAPRLDPHHLSERKC